MKTLLTGTKKVLAALLLAALCQSAGATTLTTVNIDLDAPSYGAAGSYFIRFDYTFDVAAGANELNLNFINGRQLELTNLDAVRTGFFPTISGMTGQFGYGNALIASPWAMSPSGGGVYVNENVGLTLDATSLHLFFTASAASTGLAGAIVFAIGNVNLSSIAIGNAAVPEATSSLALLGLGFVVFAGVRRRMA